MPSGRQRTDDYRPSPKRGFRSDTFSCRPSQPRQIGASMTEFTFDYVSVASSGGEYFQVLFADKKDSDDAETITHWQVARGFAHLDPMRWVRYPRPHRVRSSRIGQFGPHGVGQNHAFKQNRKEPDLSDQDQVVDRAGVGDNKPHDGCQNPRRRGSSRSRSRSSIV